MSKDILYVPMSQDELTSVIITLDAGLKQVQSRAFREDAKQVRARLVNLLLMCSPEKEEEQSHE